MRAAPGILAVTPPEHPSGEVAGQPSEPGTRVAQWRAAGLLRPQLRFGLLLRPAPELTPALLAMGEAAADADIPCFLALAPSQDLEQATQLTSRLTSLVGVHLKSGWTLATLESWIDATRTHELALGLSCHQADPQLPPKLSQHLNYCSFAPVYPPQTQTLGVHKQAVGLSALRAFAARTHCPTLALGGVDASRVPDCFAHGAQGTASIRALFGATPQLNDYAQAVASAMAVGASTSPRTGLDATSPQSP